MRLLKILFGGMTAFILVGCSTQLENTNKYLNKGDTEAATAALIDYAEDKSIEQLESTEYKTGLNFIDLMEEVNSNPLLLKIYNIKFQNSSKLLSSKKLSIALLRLSNQRNFDALKSKIATKVEEEIAYHKHNYHSKRILELTEFASLYLSSKNRAHPNLSRHWQKFPFEKNIDFYAAFWERSKASKSNSMIAILEKKLEKHMLADAQNIAHRANRKEVHFIFTKAKDFDTSSTLDKLKQIFQNKIESNHKDNSALKTQIDSLNKKINLLQADYNKAHHSRNELKANNQYNFKEIVKCHSCRGETVVNCSSCSGSGECRHCDRGQVDCRHCSHGGYSDCRSCSGWGSYRVKRSVWDRCKKCYVVKTFRETCSFCCGSGKIACRSCNEGFHACFTCRGSNQCLTCAGSGKVDCRSCSDGTKVIIQKTDAGQKIDQKIKSLGHQLSSLRKKLSHNNQTKSRNTAKSQVLQSFLKN